MEGYTEIVKIAEAALDADTRKAQMYMERFIAKFPKHELIKPFSSLLKGEKNPSGLHFDNNPKL